MGFTDFLNNAGLDPKRRYEERGPDFVNKTACLPVEMHGDWLSALATENVRRISEANEWNHVFHTPRTAEYIFTACARLRLPQEVKYSALLIFDNFMVQLVNQLYESVYNSNRTDRTKYKVWERIEATLSRQTALRIVSAIQIASKLHSFHNSLSVKTVKLCMKTLGFAYTEKSIIRSELRVLSMIDWKPANHCTPLVYAESLFKILKMKWNREIDADTFWKYILLALDCVCIHWDEVYKRMLNNVMGPSASIVTREQMCRVQADWLLLACGIIVTAACCMDGMQAADGATIELHRITNVPMADITDMSVAIIECVVSRRKPAKRKKLKERNSFEFDEKIWAL